MWIRSRHDFSSRGAIDRLDARTTFEGWLCGDFRDSGEAMSERHGRLFELAADAIFTVDETGHVTSVNLIMLLLTQAAAR